VINIQEDYKPRSADSPWASSQNVIQRGSWVNSSRASQNRLTPLWPYRLFATVCSAPVFCFISHLCVVSSSVPQVSPLLHQATTSVHTVLSCYFPTPARCQFMGSSHLRVPCLVFKPLSTIKRLFII